MLMEWVSFNHFMISKIGQATKDAPKALNNGHPQLKKDSVNGLWFA